MGSFFIFYCSPLEIVGRGPQALNAKLIKADSTDWMSVLSNLMEGIRKSVQILKVFYQNGMAE